MFKLGIITLIVNLIICLKLLKEDKKRYVKVIILSLIMFIGNFWGYLEANFLLADTVSIEIQINRILIGNSIMIVSLIIQLLIFIKLMIDILKNRKEGGKPKCQE